MSMLVLGFFLLHASNMYSSGNCCHVMLHKSVLQRERPLHQYYSLLTQKVKNSVRHLLFGKSSTGVQTQQQATVSNIDVITTNHIFILPTQAGCIICTACIVYFVFDTVICMVSGCTQSPVGPMQLWS